MEEYEIRADYDQDTIVVYQAFSMQIGLNALKAQCFVSPFSFSRMTWIKPSYLWLMQRSGWAKKENQECILAIRITRQGWEEALSQAALTSYHKGVYRDEAEWRMRLAESPVRVQWDPERTLREKESLARSIQVGLSPSMVEKYVEEWTVEIKDATPLTQTISQLLQAGEIEKAEAMLPEARVYPLASQITRQLGMPYALEERPG